MVRQIIVALSSFIVVFLISYFVLFTSSKTDLNIIFSLLFAFVASVIVYALFSKEKVSNEDMLVSVVCSL
jgi:ABC-type Fe3+-siderophore transport system permease subunit